MNLARFDLRNGQPVRPDHLACLDAAVVRFEEVCFPERGRFYHLGREYYDLALALLGHGAEVHVAVGNADTPRKKHRVRRPDDALWLASDAMHRHLMGGNA